MSDENEIVSQDAIEIESSFLSLPKVKVCVVNTPLPVEEQGKSTRNVKIENTPLLVREENVDSRKVTVENTKPILVKVESTKETPLLAYTALQQWQYTAIAIPAPGGPGVFNDFLREANKLGDCGWEMVAISGTTVMFKRPYLKRDLKEGPISDLDCYKK